MIPPFLTKIFAGKATEVVGKVLEGADKLFTSKAEKAELEIKLTQEVNRALEQISTDLLKELELQNADRHSAREREAAFLKSTGRADYFQYFIGGIAVICMVGIIVFILNKDIPDKNEHVVMLVIGEILGIVTGIYAYHFGSSQGSRIKDMRKQN